MLNKLILNIILKRICASHTHTHTHTLWHNTERMEQSSFSEVYCILIHSRIYTPCVTDVYT